MKMLPALLLSLTITLILAGCDQSNRSSERKTDLIDFAVEAASIQTIPEDFSFSIVWGVADDCSYDSRTGKLIKDHYATHPEDYVAEYRLTDTERALIYERVKALNLDSLRECYEPEGSKSKPAETIVLTVCWNGREKTIKLVDTCSLSSEKNPSVGDILPVCNEIITLLAETDVWKALPEFETLYQ